MQSDKFKKKKSSKNNYLYLEEVPQQQLLQENIKYKANEIKPIIK